MGRHITEYERLQRKQDKDTLDWFEFEITCAIEENRPYTRIEMNNDTWFYFTIMRMRQGEGGLRSFDFMGIPIYFNEMLPDDGIELKRG